MRKQTLIARMLTLFSPQELGRAKGRSAGLQPALDVGPHKADCKSALRQDVGEKYGLATAALLLGVAVTAQAAGDLVPAGLRCESLQNPLGIDEPRPRLSWVLEAGAVGPQVSRGVTQSAYRILVASSLEGLAQGQGNLWDSGKVASDRNFQIEYAGQPLATRQRCHWKVQVWDGAGSASSWSAPAQWTMGLLKPDDWPAHWITSEGVRATSLQDQVWIWSAKAAQGDPSILPPGARWFRKRFSVPAPAEITEATLSLSADNAFVAFLNGMKVLEGSTWQTLSEAEVGQRLAAGDNVLAVAATNGGTSPNPAGLIGFLTLVKRDGTRVTVPVDTTWRAADHELAGWTGMGFDDQAWSSAAEVARFGGGQWGTEVKAAARLPLLRTAFRVDKPVRRAELALCGLGFCEPRLNGQRLEDTELEPGWTDYRKTCLYRVHDLTARLAQGENVLGVMLGNGMYNVVGGRYTKFTGSFGPPKLIARLDLEYADGTTARVVSDPSWKTAPGPLQFSCIYGGEDYDARKEPAGWDRPGFDASAWQPAGECAGPGGRLSTREAPPSKVMETFQAVSVRQPRPGRWVYDLGQNFSGWPQLSVEGPAGATVKMITGELLDQAGLVSQGSSGGPVWFAYTLKGEGLEIWRPRFSYTGFRYVQVEGAVPAGETNAAPGVPRIRNLEGLFLYPDTGRDGAFSCSNPEVNRVHGLILAAIKSNFKSVLTDCPHREKLGWLECSHLLAGCFMYNFDCARFYRKIADDMREAQLANGMVPDIAPEYVVFSGGFRDSPEWGSACVIAPWRTYWMYGDQRILAEQHETMKRYVAYLGSRAKGQIVSHGLGDWYDIGPRGPGESQLTSLGLTATGVYYQDIEILRQIAALLGKDDDVRAYAKLASEVRSAFTTKFFHADKAQYDRSSQTGNAMPLVLGLVEPGREAAVLDNLARDIRARGNRVTAGDVGFYYVVQALLHGGRSDVLYDMLCQTNGPGYLYQLRKNATSLTEAWDTNPASSQNHCMLGHVEEWFYSGLLGIRAAAPGFRQIILQPQPVGDLTWAKGHYDSVSGRIASAWKRDGAKLTMDLTIPPNTTATVYVPASPEARVTESGKPAEQAQGVKFLRREGKSAVYAVGSGVYQFESLLD
jgi:alpha-L-rhamnosidase